MFYENFQNACKNKNITPTQLLKTLNISTGSLGTWKNGALPRGDILIKLSTHLNVSIDYLIFGKSEGQAKEKISNLSIDEQNLIDIYREVDDYGKHEIQSYMREIWAEHRTAKKGTLSHSEENNMIG